MFVVLPLVPCHNHDGGDAPDHVRDRCASCFACAVAPSRRSLSARCVCRTHTGCRNGKGAEPATTVATCRKASPRATAIHRPSRRGTRHCRHGSVQHLRAVQRKSPPPPPLPPLRNDYILVRHGESVANQRGIIVSDATRGGTSPVYGLTARGRAQAAAAGDALAALVAERYCGSDASAPGNIGWDGAGHVAAAAGGRGNTRTAPDAVHLYTSDFTRARQTAEYMRGAFTRAIESMHASTTILPTTEAMRAAESRGAPRPTPTCTVRVDARLRERYFGEFDLCSDAHYADVWRRDAITDDKNEGDGDSDGGDGGAFECASNRANETCRGERGERKSPFTDNKANCAAQSVPGSDAADGDSHDRTVSLFQPSLSESESLFSSSSSLPSLSQRNVESASAVARRTVSLVRALERRDAERDAPARAALYALVAHGDVLQILYAALCGVAPARHRSLPHMDNCELRLVPRRTPP